MQVRSKMIMILALLTTIFTQVRSVAAQDLSVAILELDRTEILKPCRPGMPTKNEACTLEPAVYAKVAVAGVPGSDVRLDATVSGGRIVSKTNAELKWDLAGVTVGSYTITVVAIDKAGRASGPRTATVNVAECPGCKWEDSCPSVSVKAPEGLVEPGSTITFRANVSTDIGGDVSFNWTLSAGTIVKGQGTREIDVEIDRASAGANITATVEMSGTSLPGFCSGSGTTTASDTVAVSDVPKAVPVDEFAVVGTNCEAANARLDAYFIELNNNPADRGVIVIYRSVKSRQAAANLESLLRNFIKFRRYDPSRITFNRGPFRDEPSVQFWRVPPGATDPDVLPANVAAPQPLPDPGQSTPYHYATEFTDGLPECQLPMYDPAAYAAVLNAEPRSRGKIIIGQASRARFARKQREIIAELSAAGVARSRLTFVYKAVRANRALEMTELWVVPPSRGPFD